MTNTITICGQYEASQFSVLVVPAGAVLPFAGSVPPAGYLVCDGGEVSKELFADLYAVIGDAFGAANVVTDFKLPDLRGRSPIGAGQGAGLSDRVIGIADGSETHQLTVEEMPAHAGHIDAAVGQSGNNAGSSSSQNGIIEGGDQPHNNMQPFLVMNYIIKA